MDGNKKKKQPNSPCPFQNHLLSMTTHPATLVLRVLVCQKQGEFGTFDNLIAFKPLLYKRKSYFRIIYFYRHLHPPATHFDIYHTHLALEEERLGFHFVHQDKVSLSRPCVISVLSDGKKINTKKPRFFFVHSFIRLRFE